MTRLSSADAEAAVRSRHPGADRRTEVALCCPTFGIFSREPYREHLDLVEPHVAVPDEEAPPFPCTKDALVRSPRETKGEDFGLPMDTPGTVCATDGGCC
jgi:hypothetical protein